MDDNTKKEIAEEVTKQVLQSIVKEVVPAVEKTIDRRVNGKIDRLYKLVEEYREENKDHMEEVEPFLEGWRGGKRLGNVIKWFAGLIVAVGAGVAAWHQIIKHLWQ